MATIFSVTFTKQEASSLLRVLMYGNVRSNDDLQFTVSLLVDGVVRQRSKTKLVLDNSGSDGEMSVTVPMLLSGVAAGSRSIVFDISNQEPDSPLYVDTGAVLEIQEIKQAAQ